jgi:hypothetical protein
MPDDNTAKPPQRPRLKPTSLYPLKPEKALALFMRVDPERVKEAERRHALPSGPEQA